MSPQFDKTNNLNLPPPVPEAPVSLSPETGEQDQPSVEQASNFESQPQIGPVSATPMPAIGTPTLQQGIKASNDVPATTNAAVPTVADDADLIEKEWVTKAKQIVERTKEDPHLQSKEMTVFKADYMQKRYNKAIKVSE